MRKSEVGVSKVCMFSGKTKCLFLPWALLNKYNMYKLLYASFRLCEKLLLYSLENKLFFSVV